MNGEYIYRAFENGEKTEVTPVNKEILSRGLYIVKVDEYISITPKVLSFSATEAGASDGVYEESELAYEDAMLTIASGREKDKEYYFLANIDENVPVYHVDKATLNIFPAKKLKRKNDIHTVVTALNKKGTMIAAIYLV